MNSIFLETLVVVSYIAVGILCFWAGKHWQEDKEKEKASARIIRPAIITVKPQYHVTEYVAEHPEDLELDFPPVKKVG